jgi:hypothetical protein
VANVTPNRPTSGSGGRMDLRPSALKKKAQELTRIDSGVPKASVLQSALKKLKMVPKIERSFHRGAIRVGQVVGGDAVLAELQSPFLPSLDYPVFDAGNLTRFRNLSVAVDNDLSPITHGDFVTLSRAISSQVVMMVRSLAWFLAAAYESREGKGMETSASGYWSLDRGLCDVLSWISDLPEGTLGQRIAHDQNPVALYVEFLGTPENDGIAFSKLVTDYRDVAPRLTRPEMNEIVESALAYPLQLRKMIVKGTDQEKTKLVQFIENAHASATEITKVISVYTDGGKTPVPTPNSPEAKVFRDKLKLALTKFYKQLEAPGTLSIKKKREPILFDKFVEKVHLHAYQGYLGFFAMDVRMHKVYLRMMNLCESCSEKGNKVPSPKLSDSSIVDFSEIDRDFLEVSGLPSMDRMVILQNRLQGMKPNNSAELSREFSAKNQYEMDELAFLDSEIVRLGQQVEAMNKGGQLDDLLDALVSGAQVVILSASTYSGGNPNRIQYEQAARLVDSYNTLRELLGNIKRQLGVENVTAAEAQTYEWEMTAAKADALAVVIAFEDYFLETEWGLLDKQAKGESKPDDIQSFRDRMTDHELVLQQLLSSDRGRLRRSVTHQSDLGRLIGVAEEGIQERQPYINISSDEMDYYVEDMTEMVGLLVQGLSKKILTDTGIITGEGFDMIRLKSWLKLQSSASDLEVVSAIQKYLKQQEAYLQFKVARLKGTQELNENKKAKQEGVKRLTDQFNVDVMMGRRFTGLARRIRDVSMSSDGIYKGSSTQLKKALQVMKIKMAHTETVESVIQRAQETYIKDGRESEFQLADELDHLAFTDSLSGVIEKVRGKLSPSILNKMGLDKFKGDHGKDDAKKMKLLMARVIVFSILSQKYCSHLALYGAEIGRYQDRGIWSVVQWVVHDATEDDLNNRSYKLEVRSSLIYRLMLDRELQNEIAIWQPPSLDIPQIHRDIDQDWDEYKAMVVAQNRVQINALEKVSMSQRRQIYIKRVMFNMSKWMARSKQVMDEYEATKGPNTPIPWNKLDPVTASTMRSLKTDKSNLERLWRGLRQGLSKLECLSTGERLIDPGIALDADTHNAVQWEMSGSQLQPYSGKKGCFSVATLSGIVSGDAVSEVDLADELRRLGGLEFQFHGMTPGLVKDRSVPRSDDPILEQLRDLRVVQEDLSAPIDAEILAQKFAKGDVSKGQLQWLQAHRYLTLEFVLTSSWDSVWDRLLPKYQPYQDRLRECLMSLSVRPSDGKAVGSSVVGVKTPDSWGTELMLHSKRVQNNTTTALGSVIFTDEYSQDELPESTVIYKNVQQELYDYFRRWGGKSVFSKQSSSLNRYRLAPRQNQPPPPRTSVVGSPLPFPLPARHIQALDFSAAPRVMPKSPKHLNMIPNRSSNVSAGKDALMSEAVVDPFTIPILESVSVPPLGQVEVMSLDRVRFKTTMDGLASLYTTQMKLYIARHCLRGSGGNQKKTQPVSQTELIMIKDRFYAEVVGPAYEALPDYALIMSLGEEGADLISECHQSFDDEVDLYINEQIGREQAMAEAVTSAYAQAQSASRTLVEYGLTWKINDAEAFEATETAMFNWWDMVNGVVYQTRVPEFWDLISEVHKISSKAVENVLHESMGRVTIGDDTRDRSFSEVLQYQTQKAVEMTNRINRDREYRSNRPNDWANNQNERLWLVNATNLSASHMTMSGLVPAKTDNDVGYVSNLWEGLPLLSADMLIDPSTGSEIEYTPRTKLRMDGAVKASRYEGELLRRLKKVSIEEVLK